MNYKTKKHTLIISRKKQQKLKSKFITNFVKIHEKFLEFENNRVLNVYHFYFSYNFKVWSNINLVL